MGLTLAPLPGALPRGALDGSLLQTDRPVE